MKYKVNGSPLIKFLNEIKCFEILNHALKLKAGVSIILMRNIDEATDQCNGTRLLVNDLRNNIIFIIILTGTNIRNKILVPRMNMGPTNSGLPFKF